MTTDLLKTKLYIPPVRRGLIPRQRLIERLSTALDCKLVLISAPAGFGKTTLLSEWIHISEPSNRVAWVSLDKGDLDKAAADFTKVGWHYYWEGIGASKVKNEQMARDNYDLAISEFNRAIELDPGYATANEGRGRAYAGKGEYDKAIADFAKWIELDSNNIEAYYARGLAYKEQGMKGKAMADFEKCITLTDDPKIIEVVRQQIEELSR